MKLLLLVVLEVALSHAAAIADDCPNHAKAAIVLTYDDALESQLSNVVPALDSAGSKALFSSAT